MVHCNKILFTSRHIVEMFQIRRSVISPSGTEWAQHIWQQLKVTVNLSQQQTSALSPLHTDEIIWNRMVGIITALLEFNKTVLIKSGPKTLLFSTDYQGMVHTLLNNVAEYQFSVVITRRFVCLCVWLISRGAFTVYTGDQNFHPSYNDNDITFLSASTIKMKLIPNTQPHIHIVNTCLN